MGAPATGIGGRSGLAALVAITLAGLGLRVGYAVDQPYSPPPDAVAYGRIAENLAPTAPSTRAAPGVAREMQPCSSYAPGLPLLVAGALLG